MILKNNRNKKQNINNLNYQKIKIIIIIYNKFIIFENYNR